VRDLDPDYQIRLERDATTLALCVLIEPRDSGTPIGYADHDEDIVYGGQTYTSTNSFIPNQIEDISDLSVGSSTILGIIDGAIIKKADLLAHYYDNAAITITLVDWMHTDIPAPVIRRGWLGEIQVGDNTFTAELRGLKQAFQQQIGRTVSPDCDANLGDSKCGVDLTDYTFTITVTGVTDNGVFEGTIAGDGDVGFDGYYDYGFVQWLTGNNADIVRNIRQQTESGGTYTIGLIYPMEKAIQVDDTASIIPGCNKGDDHCSKKFFNWKHFRGFPFVPGIGLLKKG